MHAEMYVQRLGTSNSTCPWVRSHTIQERRRRDETEYRWECQPAIQITGSKYYKSGKKGCPLSSVSDPVLCVCMSLSLFLSVCPLNQTLFYQTYQVMQRPRWLRVRGQGSGVTPCFGPSHSKTGQDDTRGWPETGRWFRCRGDQHSHDHGWRVTE